MCVNLLLAATISWRFQCWKIIYRQNQKIYCKKILILCFLIWEISVCKLLF